MDKEKGVGKVGLCCPFHYELYRLLLSDSDSAFYFERRGAGSFKRHLEGSLGCRRCLTGTLIGIPGHQIPPLATLP